MSSSVTVPCHAVSVVLLDLVDQLFSDSHFLVLHNATVSYIF